MENKRKKALFIVNPISGKKAIRSHLFSILKLFSDEGYESAVLMTASGGDATRFAEEYSAPYDVVVTCGGDGTLNETVTGIMRLPSEQRPDIGFIPLGTTNDLAESHGIPKTPLNAAKAIVSGKPVPFDVGRFNKNRYFHYVASCGSFAEVSYNTSQNAKNTLGHFAYVLGGLKTLGDMKAVKMKLESEEFSAEGEYVYAGISNSLSIGGLIKFDKKDVDLNDGKFEVMLVKKPKTAISAVDIAIRMSNGEFDKKSVTLFRTSKLKIVSETALGWTIDGEHAGDLREVRIENVKSALRLIK